VQQRIGVAVGKGWQRLRATGVNGSKIKENAGRELGRLRTVD